MTTINSFVPPPELVDKWATESPYINPDGYIATQAAQWGADQELEACCEWLRTESKTALWQTEALRAARRPKPPTLNSIALGEGQWQRALVLLMAFWRQPEAR